MATAKKAVRKSATKKAAEKAPAKKAVKKAPAKKPVAKKTAAKKKSEVLGLWLMIIIHYLVYKKLRFYFPLLGKV